MKFAPVEGAATLFTPAFCDYLTRLHDQLDARARDLRVRRLAVLERALKQHAPPGHPPVSEANTGTWRVAPVPDDLKQPGIEISGPCSITSMFINALNPGPEGERAAGDLDDDEDSGGHRLIDTVRSAHNRLAAVNRELTFVDRERNRNYKIADGELPFLARATIRAIVLVESLPCVYEMEEMLYELGPYAAGLNAARWDLKASIFEFVMADPAQVWPDRFGVDIKTTPFLANIFRRLVAISLKRGAVPIGGMATALPNPDPDVNRAAAEAIRADKQWEAEQGFIRGWVAHIFHMKTAGDPFKKLIGSGWRPTEQMANPDNYPVAIKTPDGPITVEGTRRNARMLIEYVEGWLGGRGAKGIDSLEGKPGIHPALMEDLATGRMSVAQIAQRIIHRARETSSGTEHDFALVKRLLDQELADILTRRQGAETHERYRKALKIAMRWIKNYTELNFKSLGAYTRAELDAIAAAPDAF